MTKWTRPNTDCEVEQVMKDYLSDKGWYASPLDLKYIAEDCFLFYEGRGWAGSKYWPALVKRWILTEQRKANSRIKISSPTYKPKGQSVKDRILRRGEEE